jgi:hypothetical protein
MTTPFANKHEQELRDMWQCRALMHAKGTLQAVITICLAQEWPTALPVLLRVAFPGFTDLKRPFLCGYAQIWNNGALVCEAMFDDGKRAIKVYDRADQLNWELRILADKLKLGDRDRSDLFRVVGRWIVRDRRVGANGERLAS